MQFLPNPAEVDDAVSDLIGRCQRLRWAVAWASHRFPAFELLRQNERKIAQLTVGTHFYQTHPDFIAAFLRHAAARFVMDARGVFHPKLYLFEHEGGRWDCIIGSPNFTRAAFSDNSEVAVLVSDRDADAGAAYRKIDGVLNEFSSAGRRLDESGLGEYRRQWQAQQQHLRPLGGGEEPLPQVPSQGPSAGRPLTALTWPEYFDSIRHDPVHGMQVRLEVLEEARRLFRSHEHFSDMDGDSRKGIAGTIGRHGWGCFGSMIPNRHFAKAVHENEPDISHALDQIPLDGPVSEEQYDRYVLTLRGSVPAGITTASRLLAMKRPDCFLCVTTLNEVKLTAEFQTPKIDLKNYWDGIVEPVMASVWWNAEEPTDSFERRVWQCRAALLDVRFLTPPEAS